MNDQSKAQPRSPGLFMLGLPDETLVVVQALSRKLGVTIPEVVARAIRQLAEKEKVSCKGSR